MKDNNWNKLYLLKTAYDSRFCINENNLNGLIKNEIYCMVNLQGKNLRNTKTSDDL